MVKITNPKTDTTSCTETRHQGVDAPLDSYAWPFHELPNQTQLHFFFYFAGGNACIQGEGVSGTSVPIILNWALCINQLMDLC